MREEMWVEVGEEVKVSGGGEEKTSAAKVPHAHYLTSSTTSQISSTFVNNIQQQPVNVKGTPTYQPGAVWMQSRVQTSSCPTLHMQNT